MNYGKILKYTLSLLLAALLLYFSFRGMSWRDFIEGLKDCRWAYILMGMAASIAAFVFRAWRWNDLLRPLDVSVRRITTFNAVNIGNLANFVFPRIGEFVRCGVISRRSPAARYDKVLGTVVLERGWDMLVMLLLFFALIAMKWEKFGAFFIDKIWVPMSENMNFSLWWIVLVLLLLGAGTSWAVMSFKDKNDFAGRIYGIFRGIVQGMGTCLKMEHKWKFFLYTICIWTMYWLMAVAVMKAMPNLGGMNAADAFFLMLAGSLGWLVPVPGGIGAFHFIVSLALSTIYGLPLEMGIVYATLSHEAQAITMLLCGGVSYVWEAVESRN